DRHDLACVRARRAAARGRFRRRRGRTPLDGHRRRRRHARGDLHRDRVRAAFLRVARATAEDGREAGGRLRRRGRFVMSRALLLLFAGTLSACTLGPDFKLPFLNLPKAFPEREVAATTEPAAAPLPVPANWWLLYADPTLDKLV